MQSLNPPNPFALLYTDAPNVVHLCFEPFEGKTGNTRTKTPKDPTPTNCLQQPWHVNKPGPLDVERTLRNPRPKELKRNSGLSALSRRNIAYDNPSRAPWH